MKKRLAIVFVMLTFGSINGCLNDVEEVPLDHSDMEIPAPEGLFARVADGTVYIEWRSVPIAARYRVYRTTIFSEDPTRVADTPDTTYTDTDLVNGRAYYYSVSTVTSENIEGSRSDAIIAVPSIHTVIINGGLEFTNSRDVVLSLTAPPTTTAFMIIGSDSVFSDGTWETFSATRGWTLTEGDGEKYVYARFQDQSGAISPIVSASIILDTYAEIESLDMVAAIPLSPGGSASFSMQVFDNETGGEAAVTIEGTSIQIILEDEGGGSYVKDYTFPVSIRGTDMTVTGHFKDQAGNIAGELEMDETLSFTDPPPPVNLIGATDSTVSSITLLWETYTGDHFQSYKLYRDSISGVDNLDRLVTTMYSENQSNYTDNGLIEGKTYYYRIYVVNDLDEMSGSNEITASTFDAFPDPVVLDSLSAIGGDRLTLTWSRNNNTDFESYRIYRKEDSTGVTLDPPSLLIGTITESEITYFDDTGLDNTTHTYYYRVYVFDSGGKYSRSNEMSTEGQ